MSVNIETSMGKITIDKDVIATLAGIATTQCFGIIGMVSFRRFSDGISDILGREALSKGVEIIDKSNELVIKVNIVVCYGTNIHIVATNIIDNIIFTMEKYANLRVKNVIVNVLGVRVLD